jgi:hypothetical protein
MKWYPIAGLICIIACISACKRIHNNMEDNHTSLIEKAHWLLGKWQNVTTRGTIVEEWKKESDTTFAAEVYFMAGNTEKIPTENIILKQQGSDLLYIPTVKDQNAGKAVTFRLTFLNDTQLVFENPEHDFPQKISYHKSGQDAITAEISGVINGQARNAKFPMVRAHQ